MISIKSRVGVAVVLAMIWPTGGFAQEGRPVTAEDISGKKFCWNTGHWTTYALNGDFTSDRHAGFRWSVPEPGVILIGRHTYRQTVVLPDGRLETHSFRGRSPKGTDRYRWGTVCS